MSNWFENQSFWEDTFPFMFPAERLEAAPHQVERLLGLIYFKGTHILDLCCGPGRHSVELAKKGFRVTGVDRTPFLMNKAKEKAKTENVDVEWVLEDMREFSRPNSFDLVLNLFSSFGFFETEEDNLEVLKQMHRNLKENGIAVIDTMSKEI
ncbi:MAG: class I SAM-dependent methyltransferase, partial [bacterium]|nr:class I SAM-dependent methyltransferase [bacterium]